MKEIFAFSERNEGTRVVDATGTTVGIVADVRHGTAYVDPDPSLTDTLMAKLGWGTGDEDTYPLNAANVEAVTDDEIVLTHSGAR